MPWHPYIFFRENSVFCLESRKYKDKVQRIHVALSVKNPQYKTIWELQYLTVLLISRLKNDISLLLCKPAVIPKQFVCQCWDKQTKLKVQKLQTGGRLQQGVLVLAGDRHLYEGKTGWVAFSFLVLHWNVFILVLWLGTSAVEGK